MGGCDLKEVFNMTMNNNFLGFIYTQHSNYAEGGENWKQFSSCSNCQHMATGKTVGNNTCGKCRKIPVFEEEEEA